MIAASIAGAVFVPIDPRTRGEKLAFMLRNSGCRGLVCADYCLPRSSRRCAPAVPDLALGPRRSRPARTAPTTGRRRTASTSLARVLAGPVPTRRRRAPRARRIRCRSSTRRAPPAIRRASSFANARFGGSPVLGDHVRLPARRPALHRALAHPRQRPGRDARARRCTWACAPSSAAGSPSRGSGTSCRAHGCTTLLAARRHGDRRSTASRRGRTTPTTRCAWWSSAGMPRGDLGGRSRSASTCGILECYGAIEGGAGVSSRSARARSAPSASPRPGSR